MRWLFFISVLWGALASSIRAEVVYHPVTPAKLDNGVYAFVVSTNAMRDQIAFNVTITANNFDIETNSSISLNVITQKEKKKV